jgi:hypothetical protein
MYETMPEQLSWPAAIARDHASSVELMLDTLEGKDIVRIRPRSIFCNVEQCMLSDEGQSFYFDANHLSQFGSALVVDEILESLD